MTLEEKLETLRIFAQSVAKKDIVLAKKTSLPPEINKITGDLAITDGKRIYLPDLESLSDEEKIARYKQLALEKAIQIQKGQFSKEEQNQEDFSEYENKAAASTLYSVLEGEKFHQVARNEREAFFEKDTEEFANNFLKISRYLPRKQGRKLQKATGRYRQLAQQEKVNETIIKQYTKKFYDVLSNDFLVQEKEEEKQEIPDWLRELLKLFPSHPGKGNLSNSQTIQEKIKNYSQERDALIEEVQETIENKYQKETTKEKLDDLFDKIEKPNKLNLIQKIEQEYNNIQENNEENDRQDLAPAQQEIIIQYNPRENESQDKKLDFFVKELSEDYNSLYQEIKEKHAGEIESITRRMETLKPESRKKIKRSFEGNELDLESAIEAIIDIRLKKIPQENVYINDIRHNRDVYISLLLDFSGSMDGRGIRLVREATTVFSEVLQKIGDAYSILGFSGNYPRVDIYKVKDYNEKHSSVIEHRIGNIRPEYQNRDGAAIRYATGYMLKTPHKTNILFVISDGQPSDRNYSNPVEDTRKALLEARSKGIHPYCITLDKQGDRYLQEMYGDVAYSICNTIEELPQTAMDFYEKIAF